MAEPLEHSRPSAISRNGQLGCILVMLTMVGFGVLCSGVTSLVYLAEHPKIFLLSLTLATVCTVPYTAVLLWLDRNEKEPPWLIVGALAWGALAATTWAGLGNELAKAVFHAITSSDMLSAQLTASLAAPFFEEIYKGLAFIALFALFRHEFDNILDGVIYGAMIGMGFAWFENISYYMDAGQEGPADVVQLAWIRGVLCGAGTHATFTGITGIGFGLFRVMRRRSLRWLAPPVACGLAMFAHFVWNTFAGWFISHPEDTIQTLMVSLPLAVLVLQVPFMLLVGAVVVLVWRHEDELIVRYLKMEPADIVTDSEVARIVPSRTRLAGSITTLFRGGFRAWRQRGRLSSALIELAFARWHHEGDEIQWVIEEDAEVQSLRRQIRALRADGTRL